MQGENSVLKLPNVVVLTQYKSALLQVCIHAHKSKYEEYNQIILVRMTSNDISVSLIQGFNFTNSRFLLHFMNLRIYDFNFMNSRTRLHEFTNSASRIQEFNFTNLTTRIYYFNFTNSTSRIHDFYITNS